MTPSPAIDVPALLEMSSEQLDDLFTRSPAGPIPRGECDGTAIAAPGTEFAEIAAKVAHFLAWRGKVFDPERGELLNRITPFDLQRSPRRCTWQTAGSTRTVHRARLLETSLVAHWIRDEIREVAASTWGWCSGSTPGSCTSRCGQRREPGAPPGRTDRRRAAEGGARPSSRRRWRRRRPVRAAGGRPLRADLRAGRGVAADGSKTSAKLVWMSDVDAPLDRHLGELSQLAGWTRCSATATATPTRPTPEPGAPSWTGTLSRPPPPM
jgi:hypothetical protein